MQKLLLLTAITASSMLSTNMQGMHHFPPDFLGTETPATVAPCVALVAACAKKNEPVDLLNAWEQFSLTAYTSKPGEYPKRSGKKIHFLAEPPHYQAYYWQKNFLGLFSKKHLKGKTLREYNNTYKPGIPHDINKDFEGDCLRKMVAQSDEEGNMKFSFEANMRKCHRDIDKTKPNVLRLICSGDIRYEWYYVNEVRNVAKGLATATNSAK